MADQIAVLAVLDEPVRRRLYDAVRAADGPVTREEAAGATSVSRKLAAFHLDKLVAVGLLTTAEPAGPRQVGRAPKAYIPVPGTVLASVPPRSYADLASILLDAIDDQRPDESAAGASQRIAAARGKAVGQSVAGRRRRRRDDLDQGIATVRDALSEAGYEPGAADGNALRLRNCPFHPMANEHPDFVCAINAAFLSGLLEGAAADLLDVVPQTPMNQCCAEIRPRIRDNGAHD